MTACPPPAALEGLVDGTLDPGPIRDHLAACDSCRSALDRISDDPELRVWALAGDRPVGPAADGPGLARLLSVGCATTWPGPDQGDDPARPSEDLSAYLTPSTRPGDLGRLGPYRVDAVLGRGGMGTVFRGHDEALDRVVALKVLRPGLAHEKARARFVREARAAARVVHDHVVRVHAVANPEDGPPYLVMEYLDGPTLAEELVRKGRLAPREAAVVAAGVADGLAAAHAAGLVHRDIKPANILSDPATGRYKIADFGLARASARPAVETQDGLIAGTPAYMSPEQAQGADDLDPRSDVYSLGATLYEVLTGDLPFRGTPQMVLRQVVSDEPRPPRKLNDAVSRDLETVCLKAMAKEPHRRYASAADLAADLRRWLRGEPVRARPAGLAERLWRLARRKPLAASLVSTLALVLAVGSAAVVTLWRRAEANAATARAHFADSDRNFRQARDAVDKFYRRFYEDGLLNKPGLEKARGEFLQDILAYYREFVRRGGRDPALRADLAEASLRLGTMTNFLGDKRDALAALEYARGLFEALAHERPADREVQRKLGTCLHWIGDVLDHLGRAPEAMAVHRRGCDIYRGLIASEPGNHNDRRRLATTLGMLANSYTFQGDHAEARRYYGEALGQFRELVRGDPQDFEARNGLAMTLHNLSVVVADPGDQLSLLREALALRETLASREGPGQGGYHVRNLARTRHSLGVAYQKLGRREQARREMEDARAGLRRALDSVPGHVLYRGDLAEVCSDLANLMNDLKRPGEAVEAVRESLDLYNDLARVDPENIRFRDHLADAHEAAAQAHEALGNTGAALRDRRARLALLRRIAADRPADLKARDALASESAAVDRLRTRGAK